MVMTQRSQIQILLLRRERPAQQKGLAKAGPFGARRARRRVGGMSIGTRPPIQSVDAAPTVGGGRRGVWAIVAALLLAGVAGFLIGSNRSSVMHLEGTAHVGDHMASIESGGWFYGLSDSVYWIDGAGTHHDDGWPSCLGKAGNTTTVKFGAVPVPVSDTGATYRAVVY